MKIEHLGHSTVLLETDVRILIDPGNFSTAWHDIEDLDAIVVTHSHPDHIDPTWIPTLIDRNPRARILVEPSIPDLIDLPTALRFASGDSVWVGGSLIEAVGGLHAVIHRDIPRIGNVGVVIRTESEPTFFDPGDALDTIPADVNLVAIPAHGPWCAMKEIIDFTRELGAGKGFLVHEGLVNERGWALCFNRLSQMTDTEMTDLRGGDAFVV